MTRLVHPFLITCFCLISWMSLAIPNTWAQMDPMSAMLMMNAMNQNGEGGAGSCQNSSHLKEFGEACKNSKRASQVAIAGSMLLGAAGSASVAGIGQSSQNQLMNQNNTNLQSASLNASADIQTTASRAQLSMGSIEMAGAALLYSRSRKMDKNAELVQQAGNAALTNQAVVADLTGNTNASQSILESNNANQAGNVTAIIAGAATQPQHIANQIINNFQINQKSYQPMTKIDPATINDITLNHGANAQAALDQLIDKRTEEGHQHQRFVAGELENHAQQIAGEQLGASSSLKLGAALVGFMGVQKMMSGGIGIMQANQMKKQAEALRTQNQSLKNNPQVIAPPSLKSGSTLAQSATSPNVISGNGQNPNPNLTAPSPEPSEALPSFDPTFNPEPYASSNPEGPPAGKLVEGSPPGGGGAGGGVGLGGSTSADKSSQEEPQAQLANNAKGPAYESGGAFATGSGGRGKPDDGPNLNSLLEKFLPKPNHEDQPKNDILQFGQQASLSSDPIPLLGKDANLFQRIHETYQELKRGGSI